MGVSSYTVNRVVQDLIENDLSLTANEMMIRYGLGDSTVRQIINFGQMNGAIIKIGNYPAKFKAVEFKSTEPRSVIREEIPDKDIDSAFQDRILERFDEFYANDKNLRIKADTSDQIFAALTNNYSKSLYDKGQYPKLRKFLVNLTAVLDKKFDTNQELTIEDLKGLRK